MRDAMRQALLASGRFPRRRRAEVSLSLPHLVFAAGLEPIATGRRIHETAQAVAWRALVEEDGRVVAAAEVPVGGDVPATINRGPQVKSTVEALVTAERDERVAGASFEVQALRIDALYVSALWLHGPGADGDVFVALAPAPPPLNAGTSYATAELERELEPMARSVLAAYQRAERPGELGS
jgi:hypothetical protein